MVGYFDIFNRTFYDPDACDISVICAKKAEEKLLVIDHT